MKILTNSQKKKTTSKESQTATTLRRKKTEKASSLSNLKTIKKFYIKNNLIGIELENSEFEFYKYKSKF